MGPQGDTTGGRADTSEDSATETNDVSVTSQTEGDTSAAGADDAVDEGDESDEGDEGDKLDTGDDGPLVCPIEPRIDAQVSGTSPLGVVDVRHGWFATAGGGKCPYGYNVVLLPTIDGALDELAGDIATPGAIELLIDLGWSTPESLGRFEVDVWHFAADGSEHARGTATIEMFAGPDAPEPVLVGAFAVTDREWDLVGEFTIPWCDLLVTGPCFLPG
jgi:hypothetical protein